MICSLGDFVRPRSPVILFILIYYKLALLALPCTWSWFIFINWMTICLVLDDSCLKLPERNFRLVSEDSGGTIRFFCLLSLFKIWSTCMPSMWYVDRLTTDFLCNLDIFHKLHHVYTILCLLDIDSYILAARASAPIHLLLLQFFTSLKGHFMDLLKCLLQIWDFCS